MDRRLIAAAVAVVLIGGLAYWRFAGSDKGSAKKPTAAKVTSPSGSGVARPEPPAPALLTGSVVSASDGSPIPSAVVQLSPLDRDARDQRVARADATGKWTFAEVEPGRYNASAAASGFLPALIRDIEVREGASESLAIELEPGGNPVTGAVKDVSGGPIVGAVVRFTPVRGMLSERADHGFAAMSDADGRYQLHVADGRYRAAAAHSDYVPQRKNVELRGGERVVNFALAPGGVVEGTVLSFASGDPVPGAEVVYIREAVTHLPGVGMMSGGGRRGVEIADDRGRFRISGLETGVIRMTARGGGGATADDTAVMLGIGEHLSGVELFIERAVSISGRVLVAKSRTPAPGASVVAIGGIGETAIEAVRETGKDGSFFIEGVLPGNYRLRIESDRYLGNDFGTRVSVGEQDLTGVEIEVEPAAMISGRVEPPVAADVAIKVGAETRLGLSIIRFGAVRTKTDGTFRLGPVRPGKLTLTAIAADGRAGEAAVEVASKDIEDVVIALETKGSIAGKVISAKGKPVTDAVVIMKPHTPGRRVTMVVNGRDMTAQQSPTHEDGAFLISGLDGDDYELSVKDAQGQILAWAKPKDKDYPRAPMRVELRDGENRTNVKLRVEARDGVIRGVARAPDGNRAPDVWVTATPSASFASPHRPPPPPKPAADGEKRERREVRSEVMTLMTDDEGGGGGFSGSMPPVLTDDEGRFEIGGLRHGKYDLVGEGLKGTARGFLPGAETGDDVVVKLYSLARIEGTVLFSGNPVPEFRVELSGQSLRSKQVRDKEGKFTLFRVDPGKHTLEVSSKVGSAEVEVTVPPGLPAKVTIELEKLVSVRGRVVDQSGKPIAGAIVVSSPRRGDGDVQISILADDATPTTDADGHFELGLRPGPYNVIVLGTDTPSPIVIKPITVADQDLSLGTLTAGDVGTPHDVDVDE